MSFDVIHSEQGWVGTLPASGTAAQPMVRDIVGYDRRL